MHHRERPRWLRRAVRTQDATEPGRRHLSLLANPLESLRVRLQATLRYAAERASELGVLLVDYSKPGSTHHNQQMVPLLALNKQSANFMVASYERRTQRVGLV